MIKERKRRRTRTETQGKDKEDKEEENEEEQEKDDEGRKKENTRNERSGSHFTRRKPMPVLPPSTCVSVRQSHSAPVIYTPNLSSVSLVTRENANSLA